VVIINSFQVLILLNILVSENYISNFSSFFNMKWGTVANCITLLRIVFIPMFVWVLFLDVPYANWYGAFFFVVLASSDYLDGYLARKHKQVTNVGKILDPIADKLLISTALILFIGQGVPLWVAVVIIFREVSLTIVRLCITKKIVVAASIWGKAKTVTQIIAITGVILHLPFTGLLVAFLLYLATFLTLYSGLLYVQDIRRSLK